MYKNKKMKAIVSNGKRTEIYTLNLEMEGLKGFVCQKFPKVQKPSFWCKDEQGKIIQINDQESLETMKGLFKGQDFVEIGIKNLKNSAKNIGLNKKDKKIHKNKQDKKLFSLSKAYGADPNTYAKFVEDHAQLKSSQLIKLYSEQNGIQPKNLRHKNMIKPKILKRLYGGEISSYIQFEMNHPKLNLPELINAYAQQNSRPIPQPNQKKIAKNIQKVARFLERPQGQFKEIVNKNPWLNFKQLLTFISTEKGLEINKQKVKMFKKQKQNKRSSRKEKNKTEKEENQSVLCKNVKTLKVMKKTFGPQRKKEYLDFIDTHQKLNQEEILQKWIQTQL